MLKYLGYEKLTREMLEDMCRKYMCMMMGDWRRSENKNEYYVFNIEYFWMLWHNIKCNNKYNENKRTNK